MHYSIYNDNIIKTDTFFTKNLLKYSHFPSTVRTPPNSCKNYFIGELKNRIKPNFDPILTTSIKLTKNKTLNNDKYKHNKMPKLILKNKTVNNWTNTKNIILMKNYPLLNHRYNLNYLELCFPYCKPKLINHNIINNQNNEIINNRYNTIINNNSKKKRLFMKTFHDFHILINKAKSYSCKLHRLV